MSDLRVEQNLRHEICAYPPWWVFYAGVAKKTEINPTPLWLLLMKHCTDSNIFDATNRDFAARWDKYFLTQTEKLVVIRGQVRCHCLSKYHTNTYCFPVF